MFRGGFILKMDGDGAIILPQIIFNTIRESGTNTIYITTMDDCLFAYTSAGWRKIEERILALAETPDSMRRFRRVFIGGAFECEIKSRRRIYISSTLRQYAMLEKDIIILGVIDHFEIFSKEHHDIKLRKFCSSPENDEFRQILKSIGFY